MLENILNITIIGITLILFAILLVPSVTIRLEERRIKKDEEKDQNKTE